MEKDIPPMNWAIPGLIPEGLTLLAGPPKAGKSWLAHQCVLAVASGGIVLDDRKAKQGNVLYVTLEESEGLVQERMRELLNGASVPDFDIAYEWPRMPDAIDELDNYLSERPTRLVVIDMLVEIVPPNHGKAGPNYHQDYAIGTPLRRLAHDHNTSIVVIHHTNKGEPNPGNPFSLISGTTGLTGMTDANLVLYEFQGIRRLAAQGKAIIGS
jgi:RecA-family ATPase